MFLMTELVDICYRSSKRQNESFTFLGKLIFDSLERTIYFVRVCLNLNIKIHGTDPPSRDFKCEYGKENRVALKLISFKHKATYR